MSTTAIVFAGQGSQSIGMMSDLIDLPAVKKTFDEAADTLHIDLWKMVTEGPAELLNQTINTQPLMLAAGVATFRAWQEAGGQAAAYYAGHSLGEYTALVAAEALPFSDALPLVRFRAQSMQDAVPEGVGAMAAILGLDQIVLDAICREAAQNDVCEAVNLNAPGQIVIAGHREAVERGMALAKARGAKRALLLPMSVPSHCALMRPAAQRLEQYLSDVHISVPDRPVIQNADVRAFPSADEIKQALVAQLYRPVRWIETVEYLATQSVSTVVECVPGKILTGLNKRIAPDMNCLAITDTASLHAAIHAAA